MGLIDTHTHLESFARPGGTVLADTLARAQAAGVETMVTIGTSPEDWALYRKLAREHGKTGLVRYSVGLHPCSVDGEWAAALAQVEDFWKGEEPRPVALGEIGLDRFHLPKDAAEAAKIFAWQRAAFSEGLALAKRLGCPVVVHSRGAFTGVLTYKSAENVRAAARAQGLARLMVETDAPYLTPFPHRGKPNEPAYVRHIAEFAAKDVFGVGYDELVAITTANARRFFQWSPP